MKAQPGVSNLVFYLLDDDVSVGDQPVSEYASDYQELVLDEQTPRFRSNALSAQALGLDVGFTLTARRKQPFCSRVGEPLQLAGDDLARREAELLRAWCEASERPVLAYQLEFGVGDHFLGRVDDVSLTWESATSRQQRDLLGESAEFVVRWFLDNRPLEPGAEEADLLAELLSATRRNLPFYAHVFEQLICGRREVSGLREEQHIRLADYACKMFLRFPSYLLRRCLPRESNEQLERRACYMGCLRAGFRYNLAPLTLDQFCDYLSAKGDCSPRARVDLAWFVGELSRTGRGADHGEMLLA